MKFLIGSDIHGSFPCAKKFFEKSSLHGCGKIVVLGDFFYNGARNMPPEGYSPREVVRLVNSYADRLIAIKGNCESEVDQTVADFLFSEVACVYAYGKTFFFTHGHHYSFENLPKNPGDVFFQGHTHIGLLERKGDLILANPGSISLPKDGRRSYMVMDEKGIALYCLDDDSLLKRLDF